MEKMLATMTTKPNYESEIIKIVKGNGSPKVILNQLENYHGSDIADVMEQLNEQERKKSFASARLRCSQKPFPIWKKHKQVHT